jgi:hypothetical protein
MGNGTGGLRMVLRAPTKKATKVAKANLAFLGSIIFDIYIYILESTAYDGLLRTPH